MTTEIHEEHEATLATEQISITVNLPPSANDIKLNIHPKLYRVVITQLFNNCLKHTKEFRKLNPNDSRMINGELSFSIEGDNITLHHNQNIPNLNGKGSGYTDIKTIVEFFGGKVVFSENKENFEVYINFVLSNNLIVQKNSLARV